MKCCKDCKYFSQELGGAYYDFFDGHCILNTTNAYIDIVSGDYGYCSYFEEVDK